MDNAHATTVKHGSDEPPFIGFKTLHREMMPDVCARTLKSLIYKGCIPSIRAPGGRKLWFHRASVEAALLRLQRP